MSDQSLKRLLTLVGLAQKAGKAASGETGCEEAVRSRKAALVLLSQDASGGTQKKFRQSCFYYQIPVVTVPCTTEQLGHALGRESRSCAAILDEGLAAGIKNIQESIFLETRDRKVDQ